MDKKLEKFGITDNIGAWVNENGQSLLEKEILSAETINYIETLPGVKYKQTLKYLSTDALLQAAACGTPTSSGSTVVSDKEVSVKSYMVYEELCPQDLEDTALQLSMKPGYPTELPFEGQYMTLKAKAIKKNIENKLWINVSGSTEFEGLINQFDKDANVVDVVADFKATGTTDANYILLFRKMIESVPEEIIGMDDLTLFCGHDVFRKLSTAFLNTNNVLLQKFDFNGIQVFEFPGAEYIKIVPVNGLNAANNTDKRVVITPASNLIFVTDMVSEEDNSEMLWDPYAKLLKFSAYFKMGAAYKFGEYVVINQLS